MGEKLKEKWVSLPKDASFFYKLRHISRYNRQYSKQKAKEQRWEELSIRAKLEIAMASLDNDIYNIENNGEVNQHKYILEEMETRKARGAVVKSKVKWQKVGERCRILQISKAKQHANNYFEVARQSG